MLMGGIRCSILLRLSIRPCHPFSFLDRLLEQEKLIIMYINRTAFQKQNL
jgi:hypothetical protein